jgi:hypothetical protein
MQYQFTDLSARAVINFLIYRHFSLRCYQKFGAYVAPLGQQLIFSLLFTFG